MMAGEKPKYIVCDLCEEDEATTYCDECQSTVCESCKKAHVKQKRTKDHNLADIDQVSLSVLKVSCSMCDGQAESFLPDCNVRLCTSCAEFHHKRDINTVDDKSETTRDSNQIDTLTPGKKIINTKQDMEIQFDTTTQHPEESKHFKSGPSTDTRSTLRKVVDRIQVISPCCCHKAEQRQASIPGKPFVERVFSDSVDIVWDGVRNFGEGDTYQVRIENTQTSQWYSDFFKKNRGRFGDLKPGETYVVKVRLVKANGDESTYSENSEEFKIKLGKEQKEDRPGKPIAKQVSVDSVDIEWDEVPIFRDNDNYQVFITNTKTGTWDSKFFKVNSAHISGLLPGTTYVFKVRLVKGNGEEFEYSENSEEATTKEEQKKEIDRPGKPCVKEIYTDSVDIVWDSVQQFQTGDHYQVRLETVPEGKWELQEYEISNVKITGLKPNTSYLFKVRWVKSNGEESAYSEESDIITTTLPFALKIVGESEPVSRGSGGLDIYELPLEELLDARNESENSKRFDIGPRNVDAINEKTIMIVGATGNGKSTFVDLLANYVLGVRLDDPFRFTVFREEDRNKQKDQAQAQTDFISCYSFNKQAGTRLNYRLNVIDTPGFGDVRGKERDKETVKQIRQLFGETGTKSIQAIDAVCFLLKAPDARLTEAQKYIFKGVLSLFSQDIEENICAIITFADGGEPKVLAAIKAEGLTFDKVFCFNNSALFSDPRKNTLISIFWNMGLQSLDELFNHINTLEPKNIQLTKEVLKERQRLESTYENLQEKIGRSLGTIETLNTEMKIYQKNEKKIKKNKDFNYTITEQKQKKVSLSYGENATNCFSCEKTCHADCNGYMESWRGMCWVMNWSTGTCSKCFCSDSKHTREGYRYITSTECVVKTYKDKLSKYQEAAGRKLTQEDVLDKMDDEIAVITVDVVKMLDDMTKCMDRLNAIALRPNVSGLINPIDQMIHEEENSRMPSNEDRIEILKKFRDIASGKVILGDTSDKRRHWKYFNSKP